jgi:hypothetical protein
MSTHVSFCWTWEITPTNHKFYCVYCSVGLHVCVCVCVCVCTASFEMASQRGRQSLSISMLFQFNFLHTMIEFKTFLALCVIISKPFLQILTTISSLYFYKGCPKILLTNQLRL